MRSLLRAGVVSCLILAVQFSPPNARAAASAVQDEKPRLRMRVIRRFGKHDGYTVRVRYPQFSGTPKALVRRLNSDIRRHVDMNVPATGNDDCEFRYSCDFETFLISEEAVSILFVFEDNFQGAHPGTRTAAFNRQLYPHYRNLKLSDLVRRPVDYRYLQSRCAPVNDSYLAKHCPSQIHSSAAHALSCSESDLAPSDLANFTFSKKVIQFNFPEGRFGVPFHIDDAQIEYKQLRRVVPPTSPIYRYVRRAKR